MGNYEVEFHNWIKRESMYINRKMAPRVQKLAQQFSVIGIIGPRQSGKTTLARHLFPHYQYVNLEELDQRRFAIEDPRSFLKTIINGQGVILDEIQRTPDLLSYIQAHVDQSPNPGFFILIGSENILLSEHISQSLAGRIALVTLLPLTIEELQEASLLSDEVEKAIFQGFYPSLHGKKFDTREWIHNYIQTYIERDVRNLKYIGDLALFQKFLQLCAGRIGQLLDLTSIGNDCGISANTVRSWLSILEATYIVFLLQPHYVNYNKRVIKTPKLFFYDTAIACQLLSIQSPKELTSHYLRGNLFESMIISNLMKSRFNQGNSHNLYFWRDKTGLEVDCVFEKDQKLLPIEIKSGETINSDFFSNLNKWNELSGNTPEGSFVVYGGVETQKRSLGTILGWNHLSRLIDMLTTT